MIQKSTSLLELTAPTAPIRERVMYCQPTGPNPLNHRDGFSRRVLRRWSLNSLFQVALYLPSQCTHENHTRIHKPSTLDPRPSTLDDTFCMPELAGVPIYPIRTCTLNQHLYFLAPTGVTRSSETAPPPYDHHRILGIVLP